jgi:hypothetical protein
MNIDIGLGGDDHGVEDRVERRRGAAKEHQQDILEPKVQLDAAAVNVIVIIVIVVIR